MIFSERVKLSKEFDQWADRFGASKCPLNTITFLQQKGLLKDPESPDSITIESAAPPISKEPTNDLSFLD